MRLTQLLLKLNKATKGTLFLPKAISKNVYYLKYWELKFWRVCKFSEPKVAYVVKDESGRYIAAVRVSGNIIEWYVAKSYHKLGYLNKALKESILLHILEQRNWQDIFLKLSKSSGTVKNIEQKIALDAGFKEITNDKYVLDSSLYREKQLDKGIKTPFQKGQAEELEKKIEYLSLAVYQVATEIEISAGTNPQTEELHRIVKTLRGMKIT